MTDEEFERLKEAEKEHLRAKKKLQEALQSLQRKQRVRETVNRMARSAQSALDRASDLIGRLTTEAAHDEARLDVALDASDDAASDDAEIEVFEAKRRAARARTLIRQMKQAEGAAAPRRAHRTPPHASPASDEHTPDATESDDDRSTSSSDDLPEKTIGRMR